jgi:hypothetical protein
MARQNEVFNYLKTVESATLKEIYANVTFSYYRNENKHLGVLLKRMIDNHKIERVKKGVFKIRATPIEYKQPTLF